MPDKNVVVDPRGHCESRQVGKNTRIHAYSHVLPQAVIGTDCFIGDYVCVGNRVRIGNRVTISCGVQLQDGMTLEDDVFVGAHVTFTSDGLPDNRTSAGNSETRVCTGARIGANAIISPGLTIGRNAVVSPGAVVTQSVPANAIVSNYLTEDSSGRPASNGHPCDPDIKDLSGPVDRSHRQILVAGVTQHCLGFVKDQRGSLSVGEVGPHVPFPVLRYFLVFDVPDTQSRGEHAHFECHQFLICVKGSITVVVDNGHERREVQLGQPQTGLHVAPRVWLTLSRFSPDAVLLVLASHHYDAADYIRDYRLFLTVVKS